MAPVSELRKGQMLEYYNKHKDSFNRNRILNSLNEGVSSGIHRKTLVAHQWGKADLGFLKPKVMERTIDSNRAHQTFENTTLSQTQLVASIFKDPTIVASTKQSWKTAANSVRTAFGVSDGNFTHIFRLTDQQILDKLVAVWPVASTRLKKIQLILKIYGMDADFKAMLGVSRYRFWDKQGKTGDAEQQSAKRDKREENKIDYHQQFLKMFQLERRWRGTEPGSDRHVISLLYTLGAYSSNDLDPKSLTRVSRVDFTNVHLIETDAQASTARDSYNFMSGRLVLQPTKTRDNYDYNYILPALVQKYIKLNVERRAVGVARHKLFKMNKAQLIKLADGALGIGNRVYRKMWQNLVDKIFGIPSLAGMSAVMAHSVVSAEASYLNNQKYTPAEKLEILEKLKSQLAASVRP
jgi:hypothetical protein